LVSIGAATLLLVFIGIHNSWDTITYIVVGDAASDKADKPRRGR